MDYKSMMGFNKKKTVKEQPNSKPKKNLIIEGIKQELHEFGIKTFKDNPPFKTDKQIKEVGASQEYHKLRKNFEKTYKAYWDSVNDFQQALQKKGLKKQSMDIHRKYSKDVLGFHAWLRQSIRKLL